MGAVQKFSSPSEVSPVRVVSSANWCSDVQLLVFRGKTGHFSCWLLLNTVCRCKHTDLILKHVLPRWGRLWLRGRGSLGGLGPLHSE